MTTNMFRNRGIGLLASLAVLTIAGVASAAGIRLLAPGGSGSVVGLSPAVDPTLAGTVIASQSTPFTCGALQGTLDNYVVQNTIGTLDFYYHVTNSTSSGVNILDTTSQSYAPVPVVGAAWRSDLTGVVPPTSASRSSGAGAQVRFLFSALPIAPGQDSKYMFLRSGLTAFNPGASPSSTALAP